MNEILQQVRELKEELERIRIFCSYVAAEHDDLPQLKQVWNTAIGTFIYEPKVTSSDLNFFKVTIMKTLLELEDRIKQLEK